MSEKLNQANEKSEKLDSKEVREHINELGERLKKQAESAPSKKEQQVEVEKASKSAEKLALSSKEHRPHSNDKSEKEPINRGLKKQTYRATMKRVEAKLPAYQRTFSKVINNDAVDKLSNVMSKTVARPSALLGGGLTAFIGLAVVTYYANDIGFEISGSEFVLLVAAGWVIGLLVEGIYKAIRKLAK